MCGSRKFCQRGPNSDGFFFPVDQEREDQNITTSGPLSALTSVKLSIFALLVLHSSPILSCQPAPFRLQAGTFNQSEKRSGSWSDGFARSQLIWIYTFFKKDKSSEELFASSYLRRKMVVRLHKRGGS